MYYWWENSPGSVGSGKGLSIWIIGFVVIIGAINIYQGGFGQLTEVFAHHIVMPVILVLQSLIVLWAVLGFRKYVKIQSEMRKRWNLVRTNLGQEPIKFKPMIFGADGAKPVKEEKKGEADQNQSKLKNPHRTRPPLRERQTHLGKKQWNPPTVRKKQRN